jgi:RNA polymerase sigma factor (sigma-70 family)
MPDRKNPAVVPELNALLAEGAAAALSDRELVERFASERAQSLEAAQAAEMAFEVLVQRHGAMVWGVCRRLLGNVHEAEDAFQATFLLLVRQAATLHVEGSLGRWLYGVAQRVALRARYRASRRATSPGCRQDTVTATDDFRGELELREIREIISDELDRLPLKYRCAIELCYLQGMTHEQAARQLDWPVATVKTRLSRGRLRLRRLLVRRGLAPSVASLTAALYSDVQATMPPNLIRATARAATGRGVGGFSAAVAHLAQIVLKTMMLEKLKLVAIGTLIAFGLGLSAQALSQKGSSRRAVAAPQIAAKDVEKPIGSVAPDPRWIRSLPSGATIEVVGVSSLPFGPESWWRPDGTPLQPAPYDSGNEAYSGDTAGYRSMFVRLTHIPQGAEYQVSMRNKTLAAQGPATTDAKSKGSPVVSMLSAKFAPDERSCTVRFKLASGPWKTIHTTGKDAAGVIVENDAGCIFTNATASGRGTTMSVTHNLRNKSLRLVGVDTAGLEYPAIDRASIDVTHFEQIEFQFDVSRNRIKEFRLQSRVYEEVEIPGIALKRQ